MIKRNLAALLPFVLLGLSACTGGTHTCTITGLIKDHYYMYSYVDGDGRTISDAIQAPGETFDVPNIPNSVGCDIGVVEFIVMPQDVV